MRSSASWKKTLWPTLASASQRVVREFGGAYDGGFYGGGQTDELFEGVAEEVGDPEVAAGVDGDGVGAKETGLGGPARGWGDGLAGGGGGGGCSGELSEDGGVEVADPDVSGAVDGDALGAVEVAVAGVTVGDDRAGAGDLADTVAAVVGQPDVAGLIDGEAIGAIAAAEWSVDGAVVRDAVDDAVVLVADPGVVVGVDGDGRWGRRWTGRCSRRCRRGSVPVRERR